MSKDINKREDFVNDHIDLDLSVVEGVSTDWEGLHSPEKISKRTLVSYLNFLEKLKLIQMIVFGLLFALIVGLAFKFLLFTKFEMYVFDDGTDALCIYDPSTEDLKQNVN